jgi:hypothetical protein
MTDIILASILVAVIVADAYSFFFPEKRREAIYQRTARDVKFGRDFK